MVNNLIMMKIYEKFMNYAIKYIKKTDLGIRYEINRSVQVCPNCQCYLNISLILTKSSILASALSICSSTIFRLYLKNSL